MGFLGTGSLWGKCVAICWIRTSRDGKEYRWEWKCGGHGVGEKPGGISCKERARGRIMPRDWKRAVRSLVGRMEGLG